MWTGLRNRSRSFEELALLDVAVAEHSKADEPGAQPGRPACKCATIGGDALVACLRLATHPAQRDALMGNTQPSWQALLNHLSPCTARDDVIDVVQAFSAVDELEVMQLLRRPGCIPASHGLRGRVSPPSLASLPDPEINPDLSQSRLTAGIGGLLYTARSPCPHMVQLCMLAGLHARCPR